LGECKREEKVEEERKEEEEERWCEDVEEEDEGELVTGQSSSVKLQITCLAPSRTNIAGSNS
jgi:hypothetical protein